MFQTAASSCGYLIQECQTQHSGPELAHPGVLSNSQEEGGGGSSKNSENPTVRLAGRRIHPHFLSLDWARLSMFSYHLLSSSYQSSGGRGPCPPVSVCSQSASPFVSAAEATPFTTIAATFFSYAHISHSFSATMPKKQPFGKREEKRKQEGGIKLCVTMVVGGESIGMEMPEHIWREEYRGMEGGTWKGRAEIHSVGCVVVTVLRKP